MREVLIVSPHFPPVDAADMHRIRVSVPYFAEFGWKATVLTVEPRFVESVQEPKFGQTLPTGLRVLRTAALSGKWTRVMGLGNLGLRAFPFLYSAGSRLI